MRLKFSLKAVNVDPVCHLQILRHAEQYENRHASGQLYGVLYEDEAHVTNVMAFPDAERTNREQLQAMERKQEDYHSKFNLDHETLGWYFICYKRNFWDEIEMNRYFEKFLNTSFFLVFDFKARLHGNNPYRAFRLKDEFAIKQTFKWSDLQNTDLKNNDPFVEIPVNVRKNQLFEVLMLFNKKRFIDELENNSKSEQLSRNQGIRPHITDYIEAFEQQSELQKTLNGAYAKNLEDGQKLSEKPITPAEYFDFLGQSLKLQKHEDFLNSYQESIETYQEVFERS